jgi:DNA-binding beta-propeller fold protein YncE
MRFLFPLLLLLAVGRAHAQPLETAWTHLRPLARFAEARALAADPSGRLYVADAGREVVVVLDTTGQVLATLGGPGTAEGQFDDPSDLDPTNGLILVVADAGNGRLQRFSKDFRYLSSLPVGTDARVGPSYRVGESALLDGGTGRPVAVVTTPTDELFALDAIHNRVEHWDQEGRWVGQIDGAGTLHDPVALAMDGRLLYVADRQKATVAVYDLFGNAVRTLMSGQDTDLRALTVADGLLWMVFPDHLRGYRADGQLQRIVRVATEEPLVEVVFTPARTYLLTRTRLWRVVEEGVDD